MKKIVFIGLLLSICNSIYAQTAKEDFKESVKASSPRFLNDMSSNNLSQSQLFKEVSPTGYDLFNANISFSDKDQVQKIGFSPLKLKPKYLGAFSNLRLNLTNKSGQLTSGLSIGYDNTAYESQRVQGLFDEFSKAVTALQLPVRGANEKIEAFKTRTKAYNDSLVQLASEFDDKRLNHIIKFSGGYNAQLFSILKSKSSDSDFDSLNHYAFKGHNLFVNGSYGYKAGCLTIEGAANYFNKRKSADETQTRNGYLGYSLGVTKRVAILMRREQLVKNENYIKNRFIPSVYIGFSYEQSDYNGTDYRFAEDNARSIRVYMPYLDVAVSPSAQFRLSLPIKNIDEYAKDTNGQNIGTVFSFSYKLINLAN